MTSTPYIVHDPTCFFVPEKGNTELALVLLVVLEVHFVKEFAAEQTIDSGVWILIVRGWESPSFCSLWIRFDNVKRDYVSEVFDMADEIGTMRKGAEKTWT